jgi:hypothetical protein
VLAVLAVLTVAAVAGPVVAAVAQIVYVLAIVIAILTGVGVAVLLGFLAWRWRHPRPYAARAVPAPIQSPRAARPLSPPRRAALPPPAGQVHIHHHWHGVSAEEVAAIIEQSRHEQP